MLLTQFAIQKSEPRDKPYMLRDGNGLYLLVQPNGKKLWRFRYKLAGRENRLGFGSYPEITLASARKKTRRSPHAHCGAHRVFGTRLHPAAAAPPTSVMNFGDS